MRVLVVEDEKRLAAGLRNGLEAEGFAVDVVNNGTDGLWMAREHPFDAIVLDILLPGVNGYRVCATLREEGNWTQRSRTRSRRSCSRCVTRPRSARTPTSNGRRETHSGTCSATCCSVAATRHRSSARSSARSRRIPAADRASTWAE